MEAGRTAGSSGWFVGLVRRAGSSGWFVGRSVAADVAADVTADAAVRLHGVVTPRRDDPAAAPKLAQTAAAPGEYEQLVLLAVVRLEGRAYPELVRRLIQFRGGRRTCRTAVSVTLLRMERKGWLSSVLGPRHPTPRSRLLRRYRMQRAGWKALRDALAVLDRMRADLPGIDWRGDTLRRQLLELSGSERSADAATPRRRAGDGPGFDPAGTRP